MGIHPLAERGFGGSATYERGRPSYPSEAIEAMVELAHIDETSHVVDLAAGTGKLTRLLLNLKRPPRVTAIEPVPAMRDALAEQSIHVLDGTAESLPLEDASADVVTVAQAFHWFDGPRALAEIHRVLRPGGHLAILFNARDESVPWIANVTYILDVERRHEAPTHRSGEWRQAFESTTLFGALERREARFRQFLDRDALIDRFASISYLAARPELERRAVLENIVSLAAFGRDEVGMYVIPYVTSLYVTQRRD